MKSMESVAYIERYFATLNDNKFMNIDVEEYNPAIIIRINGQYGVGVEVDSHHVVNEEFSNFGYYTELLSIEGQDKNYLILASSVESLRLMFAKICSLFLSKGIESADRTKILDDPHSFWIQMKDLIGNVTREKEIHSVLGELLTYEYLLNQGNDVEWNGPNGSSVDIEGIQADYEVKSTINRYKSLIEINSQHQLASKEKELLLFFCRFEKSPNGITIEDVVTRLISKGIDSHDLELKLEKLGLLKGSSVRGKSYKLLEVFCYPVNENFPTLSNSSFIDGKLPANIIKITYTVDLVGLENSKVDL